MNIQHFKKYAFALALALGFVVAPGLSSMSTVQAQGWDRDRRDDRWDDRRDRWDDRWDDRRDRWDDRWDRRRDRWDDRWDRRDDRWDNKEERKGYRDGLDRGQKDARTNRRPDPNNSSHYRNGSRDYREGFRRGYFIGYRQYANYRRW